MKIEGLTRRFPHWLAVPGDENGIVISCRVRLARNLAAFPFYPKASAEQQERIAEEVQTVAQRSRSLGSATYFTMAGLDPNQRRLLVERHLISPALADDKGLGGVLFNQDESLSVMVNEEDHLRLQAIFPGLQARTAWEKMNALDDELGSGLEYAYADPWGYLTACPTNVGTGMRASVLIHLPALVLTEDIDRVVRGLTQLSFTVRGFYGEGTNVAGNLFQVSNQTTMGKPEGEIADELTRLVQRLVECELEAQQTLVEGARHQVEDKIWRAYGILSNARVMTSQEFMNLLSAVRLGYSLGLLKEVTPALVNHLMLVTQPSHLQLEAGQGLKPKERDIRRAEVVRQKLAESKPS